MALIGDVILGFRELATDLPPTWNPPGLSNPVAVTDPLGIGFGAGTWYFMATLITQWGDTLPSNAVTITLAAGHTVQL